MGASGTNHVVLVVDDDRVMRTLLTRVLAVEGYDVLEAEDGDTALEIVQAKQPDLILLDVMMPARDGLEILEELRRYSDVPVVLVSARADEAAIPAAECLPGSPAGLARRALNGAPLWLPEPVTLSAGQLERAVLIAEQMGGCGPGEANAR